MRHSFGITARFLLFILPMFLLASGIGFLISLDYDERGSIDKLGARIGGQAGRIASALSRHYLPNKPQITQDLLATLNADEAVVCVELRDAVAGAMLASVPPKIGCGARRGEHQLELPVLTEPLSRLTVSFSAHEVRTAVTHRRNTIVTAIAVALIVLVASTALAFRFIVSTRLASLHRTIRSVIERGERPRLQRTGTDELGLIMCAFNDMMQRENERETALQASNTALATSRQELQTLNEKLAHEVRAHEEKRRFRDFAESASDWYWEMDAELRFSSFSREFCAITGVEPHLLLGKTRIETGIPDVAEEEWLKHLDDLRNHRQFRNFTHPRVKTDGSIVWLAINGQPVFDDDGNFDGYRGTGSDVTERVLAQKRLIEAKEASEQAARAKSEFLANMSHEIRTPINGVMGMADLLSKTPLDERQRRFTETISRSSEALLAVINDVLDFSKIEAGKLEIHTQPFDIRTVIEDVGTSLAELAAAKGIELICDVPPALRHELRGDADRVSQVLMNLANNAIKFTEVGQVVIRVVALESHDSMQSLCIEVCDSGIGIEPDARDRIFESFAQADGSTTRKYGGTGLGLTISRTLVELMGGEIGVDSAPNVGSTFWFTLNLECDRQIEVVSTTQLRQLRELRALLVVPQPSLRSMLEVQFEAWGMCSTAVSDAAAALMKLREGTLAGEPYELVFIEHCPRTLNATDLTVKIRALDDGSTLRVVAATSLRESLSVDALPSGGVDAFACKPLRQRELLDCVLGGAASDGPQACSAVSPALFAGNVLVAEDNPVNQDITEQLVRRLGLECVIVENGREAFEAVSKQHFDVVLMDCQMPQVDGFEATAEIRRAEAGSAVSKPIPIIALTANAMEGDREACLAAGMDDYLSKPFREAELRDTLRRWLAPTADSRSTSGACAKAG